MSGYRHTADIDLKHSVDAVELDDKVGRLINSLALGFEGSTDLDASFGQLMADQLRQFLGTHRSIRLLHKQRSEDRSGLADAMSLTREQIEKIYVVAILLEAPREWTMKYLKDDWRRQYERYLLEKDERADLDRFRVFRDHYGPQHMKREREQLGITDQERDLVEFCYHNPGVAYPANLKPYAPIMSKFPTPGKILKKVTEPTLAACLRRWYHEYRYFSGYSHAGLPKLMPRYFGTSKLYTSSQKEEAIEKEYDQAVLISYLAVASACAEAGRRMLPRAGAPGAPVGDLEVHLKLDDLWTEMRRMALLGKALWDLRVQHIMPPILGTSREAMS